MIKVRSIGDTDHLVDPAQVAAILSRGKDNSTLVILGAQLVVQGDVETLHRQLFGTASGPAPQGKPAATPQA